jgi:hypothetical protein
LGTRLQLDRVKVDRFFGQRRKSPIVAFDVPSPRTGIKIDKTRTKTSGDT